MKVVLFCGGLGMRLRGYSEVVPKPMVNVGNRPILWHIMKYYAHYGHKEFILCLGWQAEVVKDFFVKYNETVSNNFVLSKGGKNIDLLSSDIEDWKITFVDTGMSASIAQRMKRVEPYLEDDETFMANYADGVCDVDLHQLVDFHRQNDAIGSFVTVRPSCSFHVVDSALDGRVEQIEEIRETNTWMNGGFFVFERSIFNYIQDGEELVDQPFTRLMAENRLFAMKYPGFWSCMDTYKEKQALDEMFVTGNAPWMIWNQPERPAEIHS